VLVSLSIRTLHASISKLTWLALITDYGIDTLIRNVEVFESERTSIVLIEQDLEMIVLVALIVVRSVVLKREYSRGRVTVDFIINTLRGSLVDVEIGPEGSYCITRRTEYGVLGQSGRLIAVRDTKTQNTVYADCHVGKGISAEADGERHNSCC
jgi:hypothetical protein